MTSTVHHPQPLWLDGGTEEFLGFGERCVLVVRSGNHEYRRAKSGNGANRLQVSPGRAQPRVELDEQERREDRRKRTEPHADSILDCASNSRINGFQNDRVKTRRLRAK